MKYELDCREVQVDHVDGTVNEEIYVGEALFVDNGEMLTDSQLDKFIDMYYSELNEHLLMRAIARAESYFEGE